MDSPLVRAGKGALNARLTVTRPIERLRKLDLHGDFVKGVTWDPVGNYLATQVSPVQPFQLDSADAQKLLFFV